MATVILRGNFGQSGGLPQGTNALNAYTLFVFEQSHGLTTWLAPYTDWGQPLPLYPGVDPVSLIASSGLVGPTVFVRSTEFLALAVAGISMFWFVHRFTGMAPAAFVAGTFYMLAGETPHFFEGHITGVISIALAPFFFGLIVLFFRKPTVSRGVALATISYLLVAIGDPGFLYRFLFFAVPGAAIIAGIRLRESFYTRRELASFGLGFALLLCLVLPWVVTFSSGVRPQLTTGITTTLTPFYETTGESLSLAFIGFGGDNSYTLVHLGSYTYALDYSVTAGLFFLIPIGAAVFVLFRGGRLVILTYVSGLLALLFSTGPIYPSVSWITRLLYDNVPYFSSDPGLIHWSIWYILVVSAFLGFGLAEFQRVLVKQMDDLHGLTGPGLGSTGAGVGSNPAAPSGTSLRPWHPARRPFVRTGFPLVVVAVLALSGALPIVQNWEALSEPPTTFQFPAAYTGGFAYIGTQPALGGVLSVPFGNIYERTPWGGTSSSSQLFAGLGTGRNLVIFEAGTPQSLAMDRVIGDGLADGYSNNLTKLLNATGVQYLVSTSYPDWAYASDPIYYPPLTVEGLDQQQGLGTPVYSGVYQTVYVIPDPSGNATLFQEYYVYSGNDTLLYEILNEPWYTAADALVCLCDLSGRETSTVLSHSAGFITDPSGLATLSAQELSAIRASKVPVAVILADADFAEGSYSRYSNPWNASNGVDIGSVSSATPLVAPSVLGTLHSDGFDAVNVSVRATAPPGLVLTAGSGSAANSTAWIGSTITHWENLTYWNGSITTAGINNQGKYPYNGSVEFIESNGTHYLSWDFTPNNSTFQYLNFEIHSLSGLNGMSITVEAPSWEPSSLLLQILFNGTEVSVPSYVSAVNATSGALTYSFYFPTATGARADDLSANLGNITRFVVGYPKTGGLSSLVLSNLTGFLGASPQFSTTQLGSISIPEGSELSLVTAPTARIDTVTVATGPLPTGSGGGRDPSYKRQNSPTDITLDATSAGWYLLQLPQVYSSLWSLASPDGSAAHLVANVGLNGWLVNLSGPSVLQIVYEGNRWLFFGDLGEGLGLGIIITAIVAARWYLPRLRGSGSGDECRGFAGRLSNPEVSNLPRENP